MKNVIVTGSIAYDRIMDFPGRFREHILPDQMHVLNVSFTLNKLEENFGGTAGNIAYNLSLVGIAPTVIAMVGTDFDRYEEHLRQCGIRTSSISRAEGAYTAVANMITDLDDNQISAFYPGALAHDPAPLEKKVAASAGLIMIAPSSKKEMTMRCMEARRFHIPYCFDPGQQIIMLSPEELAHCAADSAIVIFNDYEWQLFRNKTGQELDDLTSRGIVVVVTSGAEGSTIYTKDKDYGIGVAEPREVMDPTGAGDAYRAGILLGFLNGWDWQRAGEAGAVLASYAIEYYGTQVHKPTMIHLQSRFARNFESENPFYA